MNRARVASTLVFVAIGALYAITTARGVLGGDNGELIAVGVSGGVAHPPGYPLYTALLGLANVLPGESPAHRAALVTAAIATLAVAALAWAARAWGASGPASLAGAALFAVTPLAWTLGTHAEVFALNALLAMLIVGLSSPKLDAPFGREDARALLLGLLAGLGLANHHTIALLAPIGLYAVICSTRRAGARAIAAAVLGLAIGLTPYALIVVHARSTPPGDGCVWGAPTDLAGLVRHVLRMEYGTFSLGITDNKPPPLANPLALARTLFVDSFGAALLPLVALCLWWRRDKGGAWRTYVALVASLVLAGPVFVARFNLVPKGISGTIVERFHHLPLALACLLVALSLDVCVKRSSLVAPIAAVVVAVRAVVSYPAVAEHHRPTIDLYMRNVLAYVPDRALVVSEGDDRTGAFMYARCAVGLRTDVDTVNPRLLFYGWYADQVSARLGFPVVRGKDGVLSAAALLVQLEKSGRPVFLTSWPAAGVDETFPSYPIGPLLRIVPSKKDVPDPFTLLAMNERAFDQMDLEETLPAPHTWAGERMHDYARPWTVLGSAFDAMGDPGRAEACRRRARALTPE